MKPAKRGAALRLRLAVTGLAAGLASTSVIASEGATFSDAEKAAVRDFLDDRFTSEGAELAYAGMVIGLLDAEGHTVMGAGQMGGGDETAVNGDTVFELGSVTKVFTSLLLLDAAQRGEVKRDDPVTTYLPEGVELPDYEGKPITLLHLAAQESGLPWHARERRKNAEGEFEESLSEWKRGFDAWEAADLYGFLAGFELPGEPGSKFQYSNVGMGLLAHAMERNTGATLHSLYVSRLCRPLGMNDTAIELSADQTARLATGHLVDGSPGERLDLRVLAGAGSLLSTANDLLKFVSANLGFDDGSEDPKRLRDLMQEMQLVRHEGDARFGRTAMPWFDENMYQPAGCDLLGHGGGGFGFLAFVGFDLEKRRGVVVLTSQMEISASAVGWTILQSMPLTQNNVTIRVKEIVGLGVALAKDESSGALRITRVFKESPAGRAGLAAGLIVDKIDDVAVAGKELSECLKMLGGEEGAVVSLEIFDPETQERREVELRRGKFITSG